jgi:DNA-3-methyladenine glycosylase
MLDVSPVEAAQALLGATVCHDTDDGRVVVSITETEAYWGSHDPASHAYRGRTPRNAVMFGESGHLYTYLSYGMHVCGNVVTGPSGEASAVLLRAGRVVEGVPLAQERRGPSVTERNLARGPGNLMKALGLNLTHNGVALCDDSANPRLEFDQGTRARVLAGPRVGVTHGHEAPWRFWIAEDDSVSAYRPSPRVRTSS